MISKKEVIENNESYKTLINAVYSRIGKDSIMDVVSNGIDGGFNGFIYHVETHKFAMRYRKLIVRMLEEMADDMGEDVVKMVSGFGVFRRDGMSSEDKKNLYKYLGGGKVEQCTITNLMAWMSAEEVCRMFDN